MGLTGILLMASGAVIIRDFAARNLALTARTLSYTVEPAVLVGDREAVLQAIASIAGINGVQRVEVRDAAGRLLAEWTGRRRVPALVSGRLGDQVLAIAPAVETIGHEGETIGMVKVSVGNEVLIRYLVLGAVISLCSLGLAFIPTRILARRTQEDIVAPLDRVAAVAHAVRTERAFDRRVPGAGLVEIDRLTADFNALLAELQGWHTTLKLERDELEHRATHDALTGLGNRALFDRTVEAMVANRRSDGGAFGLLYLDLDDFKAVNDQFGHIAGDGVLVAVATRLGDCIRRDDRAFRLGGDEFALLIARIADPDQVDLVIRRIDKAMKRPVELPDGRIIPVTLSVGSALFPGHGDSAGALLRAADAAMYRHKNGKREPDWRLHAEEAAGAPGADLS